METGSLGALIFETSQTSLLTWRGHELRRHARFAEHAVAGGYPLLEFLGPGVVESRLEIQLLRGFCDVEGSLEDLADLLESGAPAALILGSRSLGDFVLHDLREQSSRLDQGGNLVSAAVTLTLKEYR